MARGSWIGPVAAAAVAASLLAAGVADGQAQVPSPSARAARPAPQIRVNQQGYLPTETKPARLMVTAPIGPTSYDVVDASGHVVLRRRVPSTPAGSWSPSYGAVYALDLSAVRSPGRYRVVTRGAVAATSPWFAVTDAGSLFGPLLLDGISFVQTQRDGAHVIAGPLHRRPSHLLDRSAHVYAWPHMARGSDLITDRRLHRLAGRAGGPVDVAGGWFDAGDYLKFTHSTAYADVLLFTSARLLGPRAPAALLREARFGERWLARMWRPRTGTLLFQVGIGSGNRAGTLRGDHDLWRRPEADDHDTTRADRFVAHRPVFAANRPGRPISPNLVGRVSAAFALAAQADAARHPRRAHHELGRAEHLYARAATRRPPQPLVTALPHAFYPESSWRDDMALGGAEIALAAHRLHRPVGDRLRAAAAFQRGYLRTKSGDTLNLYDTGALADAALARALRVVAHGRLAVSRGALLADLRHQIRSGRTHARSDPFGAAEDVTAFDADSHTFGLVATVGLYDRLTRSHRFRAFATGQRTWLLGGDPWGVTAMVGIGQTFPHCMQHQVANLVGSTDGSAPVDRGAVVNGPNGAGNFARGLGTPQDGMVPCGVASLAAYDGQGSRYVDDVRAWQTDEPALDMTGAAILAAAAQLALHPGATIRRPPRPTVGRP